MVLFSILIQDENDFDFDKDVFRHYKRMIGMVHNLIGENTLECHINYISRHTQIGTKTFKS